MVCPSSTYERADASGAGYINMTSLPMESRSAAGAFLHRALEAELDRAARTT